LIQELDSFKKEFSSKRKTEITNAEEAVYVEKKMEERDVYFLMDRFGYARCIDTATFERNKETVFAENRYVFLCKNTGKVCIFTAQGQMHTIKAADVPFGKFRDKGVPVDNISNFQADKENIIFACSQSDVNLYRMIFVTRQSMCKIVDGGEFDVAKKTVAATKLAEDDELVSVQMLVDKRNIVMQTKDGYFLRFPIEEIPEKKKGAVGVRGMKLNAGDYVDEVYYTQNAVETTITYKEKQLELNKIKLGKRDSKGTKVRV
jgi:DNA gyrase subunit A